VPELSEALLSAYRQTTYRVLLDTGDLDLEVDRFSPALATLFVHHHVHSAAFLTAWNPRSEPCPAECNERANRALLEAVTALGFHVLPGVGFREEDSWPGEESFLVLGASRAQTLALGRSFQQHAVVWIDGEATPHLLICGEDEDV
jgi:hypothetical protein